jgi:hypothetical protein
MSITIDDFIENDIVDVYPTSSDDFFDFTGKIIGFRNNLVQVKDQDDDVFEVEPHQCRLSKY